MADVVLQFLGPFGLGAVVLALVNGLFSKRKLSAEATKIITDAASGTLKDVRDENTRLVARQASTESRLDAVERENRDQAEHQRRTDALIVVHSEWDRQAFYAAKQKGIQLPEPPPLTIGDLRDREHRT
jgi:hypothetical protein